MNNSSNKKWNTNQWLWAAFGIGLLVALWMQWPMLHDANKVNDDFRNLFWLHRMIDPALFDGDTLIGHQLLDFDFGGKDLVISKFSPGYGALFILSKLVGSVILFNKLLIFPLMLISIFYLYRLGIEVTTQKTAFALCFGLAILNLIISSNISVGAGLQRSFALPILITLLYYLTKKQYWRAGFVVFLSSAFYPPIFILGTATFGLSLVKFSATSPKRFSIEVKPLIPLATAVLLGGLLLLPALLTQGNDQVSTSLNQTSSFLDISSLQTGRYPLFTIFPFIGSGGLFIFGGDSLDAVIFGIIALGIWLLLKQKSKALPPAVKSLFIASFVCFVASWLAILITKSFPLYFPSRYTQSTFFIVLLFYIVLNGAEAMQLAAQKLTETKHKPYGLAMAVSVFMSAIIIYGWFRFPDRNLYFWFTGFLIGLWIILVILLIMRNLSHYSPQVVTKPSTKASDFSTKNWFILGAFIFIAFAAYGRLLDENVEPSDTELALFAFLETLPKDTLLAGAPCALDSVPLFAKRMILFSCETPNTNPIVMQDALESYYASDATTINAFCLKYGVDYLIVEQNTFSDAYIQKGEFLFEPFDSLMQQQLATRRNFILENLPPENILFREGSLFVTACPLS